jgi:hypothetical protein
MCTLLHQFRSRGRHRLWLGHGSIETTNGYLHTSLALKEKALARVTPTGSVQEVSP